jgi:hypothetical protein
VQENCGHGRDNIVAEIGCLLKTKPRFPSVRPREKVLAFHYASSQTKEREGSREALPRLSQGAHRMRALVDQTILLSRR